MKLSSSILKTKQSVLPSFDVAHYPYRNDSLLLHFYSTFKIRKKIIFLTLNIDEQQLPHKDQERDEEQRGGPCVTWFNGPGLIATQIEVVQSNQTRYLATKNFLNGIFRSFYALPVL